MSDTEPEVEPAPDLAELLAEFTEDDRRRVEPPGSIWSAIADTVAADRNGRPDRTLTLADNGDGTVLAEITPIEQRATTTVALARSGHSMSLPDESAGWRRQWLPVAAAVAIAIAGGLVTWAFSDRVDTDVAADEELITSVQITNEGLAVVTDTGAEARLIRSGDRYLLDLDVPELDDVDGYYEVWLIDDAVEGMVSLGVVTGDGRFAVPPGLEPADFPIVDVSVEPIDGDPVHSGRSIWRGRLDI